MSHSLALMFNRKQPLRKLRDWHSSSRMVTVARSARHSTSIMTLLPRATRPSRGTGRSWTVRPSDICSVRRMCYNQMLPGDRRCYWHDSDISYRMSHLSFDLSVPTVMCHCGTYYWHTYTCLSHLNKPLLNGVVKAFCWPVIELNVEVSCDKLIAVLYLRSSSFGEPLVIVFLLSGILLRPHVLGTSRVEIVFRAYRPNSNKTQSLNNYLLNDTTFHNIHFTNCCIEPSGSTLNN
jgi:hypothetical protein